MRLSLAAIDQLGTTHGYQIARHLAQHGLRDIRAACSTPYGHGSRTSYSPPHAGRGFGRTRTHTITRDRRTARAERRHQWHDWTEHVQALLGSTTSRDTPPTDPAS